MAAPGHHEILWHACQKLPAGYRSYGETERDSPDCSCGCIHYYLLESGDGQPLGLDWGACANPKSHRCGLLTFEIRVAQPLKVSPISVTAKTPHSI
jgi:hypothetical protein